MKKRELKRKKFDRMLNPNSVSVEEVTRALLFGSRNFQVPDELWEDLVFGHLADWHYN